MLHRASGKRTLATTHMDVRENQAVHNSSTEFQRPPAQSQGPNGRSPPGSGSPSGPIILNVAKPTAQSPITKSANGKKQLHGKSVARKSVKGPCSVPGVVPTPRVAQSPESPRTPIVEKSNRIDSMIDTHVFNTRPDKRPCMSLISSDSVHKTHGERVPTGSDKNDTVPDEFFLRPKGADTGASDGAPHVNSGNSESPVLVGFPLHSGPSLHTGGGHIHSHRSNGSKEVQIPVQVRPPKDKPSLSQNKGHRGPAHENGSPRHDSLDHSRGQKPPAPDRSSEQFMESSPESPQQCIDPIRFEPTRHVQSRDASIRTQESPAKEAHDHGMHTAAHFEILQTPPLPPRNGTSMRSPLKAPMTVSVSPRTLSVQFKSQLAERESALQTSSRVALMCHHPRPEADEFTFTFKCLTDRSRRRYSAPSTTHQRALERHDPDKFDSYIYSAINEPFRPGSKLFGKPWYELPPRQTRPATYFAHIDPRIHWSEPRTQQWHENRRLEIAERGGRKARLGGATASIARRQRDDLRANRKIHLPERVENNPAWLAALDELDAMVESKPLREFGLDVGARSVNAEGQQKPKPKPKQRRRKRKRKQEQQQEQRQKRQQGPQEEAPSPPPGKTTQNPASTTAREDESEDPYAELESPSDAMQRRQGRRKGKARTTMIIDDSDYDDGVDDEYVPPMELDS